MYFLRLLEEYRSKCTAVSRSFGSAAQVRGFLPSLQYQANSGQVTRLGFGKDIRLAISFQGGISGESNINSVTKGALRALASRPAASEHLPLWQAPCQAPAPPGGPSCADEAFGGQPASAQKATDSWKISAAWQQRDRKHNVTVAVLDSCTLTEQNGSGHL